MPRLAALPVFPGLAALPAIAALLLALLPASSTLAEATRLEGSVAPPDAAMQRRLDALGFRAVSEVRVMVALPGGRRGCIKRVRGTLPARSREAFLALRGAEVESPRAGTP